MTFPEPKIYFEKIFVFENALSQEDCEEAVWMMDNMDEYLSDDDIWAKKHLWQSSGEIPHVYGDQRRGNKKTGQEPHPRVAALYEKFDTAFRTAADIYFKSLGIEILEEEYTDITMCRYNTGESMGPHPDYDGEAWIEPVATGLIYLNNKVGGDIWFPDYDLTVKSSEGSLVIFPCRWIHASTLIEKGEKYHAATGWKKQNKEFFPK